MLLNYIFIGFFLIAFIIAAFRFAFWGDYMIFDEIVRSTFDQAKNGFEISLYLTGMLCLWIGFMRIAEKSGLIAKLAHAASPVLRGLFPSLPPDHPVLGSIFMNASANMLGLDNAATPLGLKAMQQLQELNVKKEKASDAMIMFLALNASGLTLIPTTIISFRMKGGAMNPSDIFIPILIATTASTLTAILSIGLRQKINLLKKPLVLFFLSMFALIGMIIWASQTLPPEVFKTASQALSSMILFGIMCWFIISGMRAKINVYDAFIEGAKEGFGTAITIIPYLVAILVGIGVFRACGAMDMLTQGMRFTVGAIGLNTDFVEAVPTMLMKPLSGSGARGLMVDAMQQYGADSFIGRLCCTVQGASDTTFYVVALYYGSVKIKNTRYTVGYSLLADLAGAVAAVLVTYMFFG